MSAAMVDPDPPGEGGEAFPVVRLARETAFEQAIALIADAIRGAAAGGRPTLLVDTRAAAFAPPGIADRHRFVRLWAAASGGKVRVALVARPDFIDPERFGVVAAANFGLAGQVFECEEAARAWLRDPSAKPGGPFPA